MKPKSNIQKVKSQISETRLLIQEFIGFSDDEWTQMFFETAIKWAEKHSPDRESCSYLTSQDMFWGWWSMEYSRVEQELLDCFHFNDKCQRYLLIQFNGFMKKEYSRNKMQSLYHEFMRHRMLECRSERIILELSFHKALKEK